MNEIFDKLIIRLLFIIIFLITLFLYKYAHLFFYPSLKKQTFKRFHPTKNPADTLHFFSRILGIGLIFSSLSLDLSNGIVLSIVDFLILSITFSSFYLISIFIIESIVLYNFEYHDEILKKKNMTYALICFANSLATAYILKTILNIIDSSLIIFFFTWLFSMVLLGLSVKSFPFLSKLSFNRLIVQKNISIGLSYMGFIWGWTLIITSSLNHSLEDIKWYSVQVILKILLCLIILPIFRKGLLWLFLIQENIKSNVTKEEDRQEENTGQGIFEGSFFLTSCFLTTVITQQIHFGTFYPVS